MGISLSIYLSIDIIRYRSCELSGFSRSCWHQRGQPMPVHPNFTRLWQKTPRPTRHWKLLNPRYWQRRSPNARFKTEIEPSIPARKCWSATIVWSPQSFSRSGIATSFTLLRSRYMSSGLPRNPLSAASSSGGHPNAASWSARMRSPSLQSGIRFSMTSYCVTNFSGLWPRSTM